MCQDNNHGGKRCPSDTSEARRLRRKASIIRNNQSEAPERNFGEPIVATGNVRFEELKAKADELRAEAYNAPIDTAERKIYDAQMEQKLTAFGVEIAAEADKMVGFHPEEVIELKDFLAEEIYSKYTDELKELDNEFETLSEAWDEITIKVGVSIWTDPSQLTDEQLNELTDDEKKTVLAYEKNQLKTREVRDKSKLVDEEYNQKVALIYKEYNDKLTEAYQTIIASIRPVGGDISYNPESSPQALETLKNTVSAHYPTSWLEKHNENGGSELIITETDERPSYDNINFSEYEDDGIEKTKSRDVSFTLTNEALSYFDVIKNMAGDRKTTILSIGQNGEKFINIQFDDEEIYDPAKHGLNLPSEENGWQYKPSFNSLTLPEVKNLKNFDEEIQLLQTKRWVRPLTTTKKQIPKLQIFDKKSANIISRNENDETVDYQKSIAYHEFGHRIEAVLPDNILPRYEQAFLMRRSGKTEETYYDNMVNTGMKSEYGHDGKFVTKYVGRDYFEHNNYEVFTVGVEALYGGGYGGLVGNSESYRGKDYDHRGFVLGTLATL